MKSMAKSTQAMNTSHVEHLFVLNDRRHRFTGFPLSASRGSDGAMMVKSVGSRMSVKDEIILTIH